MTIQSGTANGVVLQRPASETKPVAEERIDATCASCPHPWHSHDRIAVRYCTATVNVTDRRNRGCVCTMKEI